MLGPVFPVSEGSRSLLEPLAHRKGTTRHRRGGGDHAEAFPGPWEAAFSGSDSGAESAIRPGKAALAEGIDRCVAGAGDAVKEGKRCSA
jgi:hypothetical protein